MVFPPVVYSLPINAPFPAGQIRATDFQRGVIEVTRAARRIGGLRRLGAPNPPYIYDIRRFFGA